MLYNFTGIRPEQLGPEADPWREIVHFGPSFMQEARDMRKHAKHYNDFHVGAVAIASTLSNEVEIFRAANRNLQPGPNETKLCAEQNIVDQVRAASFDQIHALFISGPPQPDTQSKVVTPTLHMCGECRDFMHDAPEVDEDTLIIQVHPLEDNYEVYSFAELDALHAAGNEKTGSFNYYPDPGFQTWQRNGDVLEAQAISLDVPMNVAAYMAASGQLTPRGMQFAA